MVQRLTPVVPHLPNDQLSGSGGEWSRHCYHLIDNGAVWKREGGREGRKEGRRERGEGKRGRGERGREGEDVVRDLISMAPQLYWGNTCISHKLKHSVFGSN